MARALRAQSGISGFLLSASPAPLAAIGWSTWGQGPSSAISAESWGVALAGSVALALGSAALHARRARILASLGLLTLPALLFEPVLARPALALALIVGLATLFFRTWGPAVLPGEPAARESDPARRAQGAALGTAALWGGAVLGDLRGAFDLAPIALSALASWIIVARALVATSRGTSRVWLRFLPLAGSVAAVALSSDWVLGLGLMGMLNAMSAASVPVRARSRLDRASWSALVLDHPQRLLASSFLLLCAAGTVLLLLPQSATALGGISVVDAAFTAVSAVCVTGLIVLDTPKDFTSLGQIFILVLIQLGGLGIMTFSTVALGLLGRRMGLRFEGAVADLLSPEGRSRLFSATRQLVVFTAAFELAGALVLAALFHREGDTVPAALWRGVFTSISAFCNAGFALQSDNLIPYQENPWVLHTVAILIIVGGLSPAVCASLPRLLADRSASLQTKLAITATAVLLAGGFLFLLAAEWGRSLSHLGYLDRIHNAWFQSVTTRTAGFNSIDIAATTPASQLLMILWMFIGGTPGGTAGGVKTTTLAVLFLAVTATVRGRESPSAFGRAIAARTLQKAVAITAVALSGAFLALLALELTQTIPTMVAMFEVVSALGTVGLSVGGTGALDTVGKVIIMVCMFAGRIGTLTLFMFLSQRSFAETWRRPEEVVGVG